MMKDAIPSIVVSALVVNSASAIEKPSFTSIKKEGKFELRQYEELHIVTAEMEQEAQRNQAFRKLARYIGAQNDKEQKIAMTAPVIIDGAQVEEGEKKSKVKMSFVIPKAVVAEGIPQPNDASITLSKVKGGRFAVTSFKNSNSEKARKKALSKLRVWIDDQQLTEVGEPSFAFYNPPWIPQMLRTNEVWIRVK